VKRRHSGGRRVRGGRQGVGREYHAAGAAAAAAAMWSQVPVLVLEKVYALLALSDRYACSCVCRHWYSVFRSAGLWRHLNIARRTFTRRKVRYRPARDTRPTTLTRSILSVESNQNLVKGKVKFSHTRYRALGPELIPVCRHVSPQVT